MYVLVNFAFSYFTMIDFGQSCLLHGSSAHINLLQCHFTKLSYIIQHSSSKLA